MVTASRLVQGMDVLQNPLPEVVSFASGQHVTLDLPRTGIITHIELELDLNYDSGDVETEEEIANLFRSVTVRDGRNNTYFHISDGRLHKYLNLFQRRGVGLIDPLVADNVSTGLTARANLAIHFGMNPHDFLDPTGGIPASELSSLVLDIEWGNTASLWSTLGNGAINSASVTVTPTIVAADSPSWDVVRPTLLIPQYRSVIFSVTGAFSALTFEQDLPPMMLDKTVFIGLDENDLREDNVTTEVAYRDAKANRIVWDVDFIPWTRRLVGEFLPGTALTDRPAGVGYINWPAIMGDVALDLRDRLTGFDKIAWSTGEGGAGQRIAVVHKGWSGLAGTWRG